MTLASITAPQWLGWLAFAGLTGGAAVITIRASRRLGVLGPVGVGFGLRAGAMIALHFASVAGGWDGFFYFDDRNYDLEGLELLDTWRQGTFPDPHTIVDTRAYGYSVLVGASHLLSGEGLIAAKLLNVLLGTATIAVAAALAGRLLGERAQRRTAWLVALAPTLVWWSVPLMKESLAAFLVTGALLAATRLPRPLPTALFGAALTALLTVRASMALAVVGAVGLGLCVSLWRSRSRLDAIRIGCTAAVAAVALTLVGGGNPTVVVADYAGSADFVAGTYQGSDRTGPERRAEESERERASRRDRSETGGGPVAPALSRDLPAPLDMVRTLVAPYPWVLERESYDWGDRGLFAGMWVWYVLLPTAALGAWSVRRRPQLLTVVITIPLLLLALALTSGSGFRQRSSVEPLMCLLVAAGVDSWRRVMLRGSVALGAVALVATIHTRSLPTGAVIGIGAAALWRMGRSAQPPGSDSTSAPGGGSSAVPKRGSYARLWRSVSRGLRYHAWR